MIAAGALCISAMPAFSHISLDAKTALAGSTYKAVFQVGHGCQGSATTGIRVQIPAGFQGAKPYPKAGWTLSVQQEKLARPYDSHGKPVTEDVTVVAWTAAGKEAALQDAFFDEFVLRGKLPETTGPLWFKVLQTCESGSNDWSETPASGNSAKGLKSPAVLLEVTGPEAAAPMPAMVHAPGAHQH
ncbi:YcnI family protein [Polaromonas hydrogenivorans]